MLYFDYPSNFKGLQLILHARVFQTTFCFAFLESYIFISDQNVNAKSNRNRNYISIPLGIPRVARWIISFMLHISVIKTVQEYLIVGTTFGKHSRELEPVLRDRSVHKKIKHQIVSKEFYGLLAA